MRGAPGSEMVCCRTEAKEQPMKITYFVSAGTADPTRVSIPLHLAANGSVGGGQETSVRLGGAAPGRLVGAPAAGVEGVGPRAPREVRAKLREHEVPVFV